MITSIGVFLEKVLKVTGSSIETWKTRFIECIDFRSQRVNNKILDWKMIL